MMGLSTQRQDTRMPPPNPMLDTVAAEPAWAALGDELDAWAAASRTAGFWWRDDDAVAATPTLDRLLAIAAAQDAPLALAVIPVPAEPSLFLRLAQAPQVTVLQHGYAHRNHAPAGARKCELGDDRPAEAVLAELAQGRALLDAATRGLALPVLVPPWNRIGAVQARLGEAGLRGLSTSKPRARGRLDSGLVQANVHVDPIDWPAQRRGAGGFAGDRAVIEAALRHLRARRTGTVDATEPTGFLTHHLVMDETTWRFAERFVATIARHPAARWVAPGAVFADAAA
jgi:hypothetical protein